MGDKSIPSSAGIVIADSFGAPYLSIAQGFPAAYRRNFNDQLPAGARGLYIGGNANYKIFVELDGMPSGVIIPYLQLAGGIIHPICPRIIYQDTRYTTDAPNIIVQY
jgi:hypothetical protein